MNTLQIIKNRLIIGLVTAFVTMGSWAQEMPRLQFAIGEVKAIGLDGNERDLNKGDVLKPGEKLVTRDGAMAQLRIFEQGVVVLRDDSQLELKPAVNGQFGVSLEKGLLRTVTKLAKKKGRIDVITPVADIAVQAGDVLTGVNLGKTDQVTHNQVLDGQIKITTGAGEKFADIGKILKISPADGGITIADQVPDGMKLRVPNPTLAVNVDFKGNTTKGIAGSFSNDSGRLAAIRPDIGNVVARPGVVSGSKLASAITAPAKFEPSFTRLNYDGVKIIDPRIASGSIDDQLSVNSALIVSIPSTISNTRSFAPVTTTDPVIRSSLSSQALVVELSPIKSIAGETTLSSPLIPEVKIVTFEPEKIVNTETVFNQDLVDAIKTTNITAPTIKTTDITRTIDSTTTTTTTTIKNTIEQVCLTCTKTLTLIKR